MEGIRYIKDETGKNVAVQIDLEENEAIWNAFLTYYAEQSKNTEDKEFDDKEQKEIILQKIELLSKQSKLNQVIEELDELTMRK